MSDALARTSPTWWVRAREQLAAGDPVLAELIGRFPDSVLASRGDPFQTLVRSIVGQQISVKAADSVWGRLASVANCSQATSILATPGDALLACGLSRRKLDYIQSLAQDFVSGKLNPDRWSMMSDEEVIGDLIACRGIGRWTAEMFLIFNLARPDVFPLSDLGVLKAIDLYYGIASSPSDASSVRRGMGKYDLKKACALGDTWRPWRSVATWYLWRSLDPVEVVY